MANSRKRRNSFDVTSNMTSLLKDKKRRINQSEGLNDSKNNEIVSWKDVPRDIWLNVIFIYLTTKDIFNLGLANLFFYQLTDLSFSRLAKEFIVEDKLTLKSEEKKFSLERLTSPGRSTFFALSNELQSLTLPVIRLVTEAEHIDNPEGEKGFLVGLRVFDYVEGSRFYLSSMLFIIKKNNTFNPYLIAENIINYFKKKSAITELPVVDYLNQVGCIEQTLLHFFAALISDEYPQTFSAIRLLVQHGARLDLADDFETTPLHVMAYNASSSKEFIEIFDLALSVKFSLMAVDSEGNSLIILAMNFLHSDKSNDRNELISLLQTLYQDKYISDDVLDRFLSGDFIEITTAIRSPSSHKMIN